MKAELIAIGSELLRFGRTDTNTEWLSDQLGLLGIEVAVRSMVEDDEQRISETLRVALARADLVITTGGLGPTEDDRTREAIARALDLPLERDPEQIEQIRKVFERFGRPFRSIQNRQADRPEGALWVDNPIGTAPGIAFQRGRSWLFALPGVPQEMRPMFKGGVLPRIRHASAAFATRTLKIAGRLESSVDEQLSDLYDAIPGVEVTILTGREGLELHLRSVAADATGARAAIDELDARLAERLGDDLYGRDAETLGARVGELLTARRLTVATAESCTAGMLAAGLTDEPGSSVWFKGGLIVYSNELKVRLAGVGSSTLLRHGAVSEAVARELAAGARQRCGADLGVGVTGIAGPSGGTPDKPVGLVHLALATPEGEHHWRMQMIGDRGLVRTRTVTAALDRIRRALSPDPPSPTPTAR